MAFVVPRNPDENLSPPVEPIVWWLEKTTPLEFREIIRNAVLTWNEAFEQAGFENAIEVRIQADDAPWDAGDLRYNVLRWTSSPDPVFGGYGPSFVDPRTGQILGADIMLEWVFVTNRVKYQQLFRREPTFSHGGDRSYACRQGCYCNVAAQLQVATLLGRQVMFLRGAKPVEMDGLIKAALYFLALHEVGHALGLSHNFKASQLHNIKEIHDPVRTAEMGLTSSVMEYPGINLAPLDKPQGMYYTMRPGPYDKWAIEYGYSPGLGDPEDEEERLEKILARSTQRQLAFGNDADDMRRPGHGIDPRAMIYDMTSDPIGWADGRIDLIRQVSQKLLENYREKGHSYHELRDRYVLLLVHHASAARVVSRYIGGVYVDRAAVGQASAGQPLQPVSRNEQKRAMDVLSRQVFAPEAFQVSPKLLAHLQQQRRGFNHYDDNEDLRIHELVLDVHRGMLDHLLHHNVLRRVTNSRLYGNEYALGEFFDDLTAAIFSADAETEVNSMRQNLQTEYVRRLLRIVSNDDVSKSRSENPASGGRFDHVARATAFAQLKQIRSVTVLGLRINSETRMHYRHLGWLIDRGIAVAPTTR